MIIFKFDVGWQLAVLHQVILTFPIIMKQLLFILALCSMPIFILSQSTCEVEVEALQGSYEGDCKKGKAHGEGKAVGTDTYEGNFRKGAPHGQGKYIWASGDWYEGAWKKGKKEGAGLWYVKKDNLTLKGYWIDDEYIGTEKDPYKVLNKTISVTRMGFNRLGSEPDEITFEFTRLGKPTKVQNFKVVDNFGEVTRGTDYEQTVAVYKFPFQGTISFEAAVVRDEAGGGNLTYESGEVMFKINQSGQWTATIEVGTN